MAVLLRDEEVADRTGIRELVTAAFGRATEADLLDRLRAEGDGVLSLVALDDGRIVGHVFFSRVKAPFRALGLAPVAVLPERQRSGIGSRLIQAGLARLARSRWQAVFVVGDPGFYGRFGFDAGLARGFDSPYAGPHLMAVALGGALPTTSGRLEYARAFRDLE